MKILLVVLLLLGVSCGKDAENSPTPPPQFICDGDTDNALAGTRVGDNINNYDGQLYSLFNNTQPSVYETSTYYNETYGFNKTLAIY